MLVSESNKFREIYIVLFTNVSTEVCFINSEFNAQIIKVLVLFSAPVSAQGLVLICCCL